MRFSMFDSVSKNVLLEIIIFLAGCLIVLAAFGGEAICRVLFRRGGSPQRSDGGDAGDRAPFHRHSSVNISDPQVLASPDQWPLHYPSAVGLKQSPIRITTSKIIYIPSGLQSPLSFNRQYFMQPRSMTILNDGYSILLGTCFANEYPTLSGGPLRHRYRFNLAQFKWGPTNGEGSEHTINSRRYAMEMQLMHIKGEKVYENLEAAVTQKAVVFLSFLFEVTKQDNPYLAPLVNHLPKVELPNSTYPLDPFPLCWLFQPFKSKYFYYEGSITCPPCTEGVEWLIQPEPLSISDRQMNAFRSLMGFTGPIIGNARPVQKLNNRTVHFFL